MKCNQLCVWLLAILTVLGSTACIGDDDGKRESISILKVKHDDFTGMVEFEDAVGIVLKPTKAITDLPTSDLAYVHYNYNIKGYNSGSRILDVDVLDKPYYIPELYIEPVNNDVLKEKYYTLKAILEEDSGIWAKEFLILNLSYLLNNQTTEQNLTQELTRHEVALYYDPEAPIYNDELKLYLKYAVSTNVEDNNVSLEYGKPFSDVKYFQLSDVVSEFKSRNNGKEPLKIKIEYHASDKAGVVKADMASSTFELDYL